MLVQTSREPHYARGILGKPGNTDRIARQHLAIFWRWKVPIAEGRALAQGHTIDVDEVPDTLEVMDTIDVREPEIQGAVVAAQLGELVPFEEEPLSSCASCLKLWCHRAVGDISCRESEETDIQLAMNG